MHSRLSFSRRRRIGLAKAFSLVELMAVLAVIAILATLAVPGFQDLIRKQRLSVAVNAFSGAIHTTRAEAIRRGDRVDLVPADGADWAQGWVVLVDGNGNQRADAGETVVHRHGPLAHGISMNSVMTDAAPLYLAYNGSGRTRTNASGQTPQLGTISFFLGGEIRRIKLNFSGRARTCNPAQDRTCTGTAN